MGRHKSLISVLQFLTVLYHMCHASTLALAKIGARHGTGTL